MERLRAGPGETGERYGDVESGRKRKVWTGKGGQRREKQKEWKGGKRQWERDGGPAPPANGVITPVPHPRSRHSPSQPRSPPASPTPRTPVPTGVYPPCKSLPPPRLHPFPQCVPHPHPSTVSPPPSSTHPSAPAAPTWGAHALPAPGHLLRAGRRLPLSRCPGSQSPLPSPTGPVQGLQGQEGAMRFPQESGDQRRAKERKKERKCVTGWEGRGREMQNPTGNETKNAKG